MQIVTPDTVMAIANQCRDALVGGRFSELDALKQELLRMGFLLLEQEDSIVVMEPREHWVYKAGQAEPGPRVA